MNRPTPAEYAAANERKAQALAKHDAKSGVLAAMQAAYAKGAAKVEASEKKVAANAPRLAAAIAAGAPYDSALRDEYEKDKRELQDLEAALSAALESHRESGLELHQANQEIEALSDRTDAADLEAIAVQISGHREQILKLGRTLRSKTYSNRPANVPRASASSGVLAALDAFDRLQDALNTPLNQLARG